MILGVSAPQRQLIDHQRRVALKPTQTEPKAHFIQTHIQCVPFLTLVLPILERYHFPTITTSTDD